MSMIKVIGNVDEDRRLSAQVPASFPPGPVTVLVIPEEDVDEADAWAVGIAREWADELGDSEQDIYTLADGEASETAEPVASLFPTECRYHDTGSGRLC
ncbi:MAG: hypothetical protein ACLP9L_32430 [Thermoguttaceae bacterium]